MKYTYQIKFGAAAYVSLTPNTEILMSGEWEGDTMIWREKISELKITAALNSSVYSTLESWFDDETKFESLILVKILKNAVQDSVHWFGIKWGDINKHTHTFVVEPSVYDYWGQYFEGTSSIGIDRAATGLNNISYYNTGTTYPYINQLTTIPTIEDAVKDITSTQSGWTSSDVVSSFLWGDTYEDTSAVGTVRGMPMDYVTSDVSYLKKGGLVTGHNDSFDDVLGWMKMFRCHAFFDDNDKLRLEHISFFNDKLTDNAVDFSAYINDYNEVYRYKQETIPVVETLAMKEQSSDSDTDFLKFNIIYSGLRNRPDAGVIDHSFQMYSYLTYYTSDSITDRMILLGGLNNHTYKFFDIDMLTFSSSSNSVDVTWDVSEADVNAGSNDFQAENTTAYSLAGSVTSLTGEFEVSIVDRSSSAVISNVETITSTGTVSETLTTTAAANDAYLLIEGTVGDNGAMAGWFTLEHSSAAEIICPTIDGVFSSNPKTNGSMSVANMFERWWQDDRQSRDATVRSTAYNFDGTIFNLERDTVEFHYSGVINPLYGFNDGTRVGRIDKWKRSLDTDFYEIDVIYQEDE